MWINNEKFEEAADNGLNYFLDFCKQRGYTTFSDYPVWNAYDVTVSGKKESLVELKKRECTVTQFPDCYFEVDKCEKIQKCAKEEDKQLLYVALYPKSNKICIWEIDKDKEYEWVWRNMNYKTCADNKKKIWKKVILLPISEAKQVDYQFD